MNISSLDTANLASTTPLPVSQSASPSAKTATSSSSTSSSSASSSSDDSTLGLANESTFLKLFVAQLKNQDPMNPDSQDPTQMISELAQFSQLEQSITLNGHVSSIQSLLSSSPASATSGSTSPSSTQET